jgi:Flp pilus assembly protein TadD
MVVGWGELACCSGADSYIRPGMQKLERWLWPFRAADMWSALAAGLVALCVYVTTAAPNVGLLDSGEFLVAAMHFGVPHPTGYPLWTLTSWLFQLLPLGNAAWEINIWSGVCGALAVGLAALLISNCADWLVEGLQEGASRLVGRWTLGPVLGCFFAITLAFSIPMWTQAVIAEVYQLHALIVLLYVASLYRFIRDPSRLGFFYAAVFFYALGWSNHHLMLSLTPLLVVVLLFMRSDLFLEFSVYLALTGSLVYLLFSLLADNPDTPFLEDPATVSTAWRFFLCVVTAFLILLWNQRKLYDWRALPWFLALVAAGLLPYAYMPIASSTNPPMNWGYTREPAGFFWSVNRSQYPGPLTQQLQKTVGKFTGSCPADLPPAPPLAQRIEQMNKFFGLYWSKIAESFTFAAVFSFFICFAGWMFLDYSRRIWILILYIAFLMAAFFQPFFDMPSTDLSGWLLQMPYHTYSFALFAVLSGVGTAFALAFVRRRWPRVVLAVWAVALLPVAGWLRNHGEGSQRDHWFGWHFGYDMLHDLPRDSFVFGGTDPGRFVPTYMILGESTQPARVKRSGPHPVTGQPIEPFDRRDLYIITQNALADPFYLKYFRDHYTTDRPPVRGWFEKWLGRGENYPKDPIVLPRKEDVDLIIQNLATLSQKETGGNLYLMDAARVNGAIAQWIFERNRDQRRFFVEESFPMEWTYPHAIPHGLCYEIARDPLPKLPPEVVEKDFAYWKVYLEWLLGNPHFHEDIDAQRSFSKLRGTTGNIYRHRNLLKEAEQAYRQALSLWPSNTEVLGSLTGLLLVQRRFQDAFQLIEAAYRQDPRNVGLMALARTVAVYQELDPTLQSAIQAVTKNPRDKDAVLRLLGLYQQLADPVRSEELIRNSMKVAPKETGWLAAFFDNFARQSQLSKAMEVATAWEKLEPKNADVKFYHARVQLVTGDVEGFYARMRQAVLLGGDPIRQRLLSDPTFQPIAGSPEFGKLLAPAEPAARPAR